MELSSVAIRKFRSVDDSEMIDCGRFNVLIGRNNTGKSSILVAIDSFFACVREGSIVALSSPIGAPLDFYQKDTGCNIEIKLTFSLTSNDRDKLAADIIADAPQMRRAVEDLPSDLRLSATLTVVPPPGSFAFLSEVVITASGRENSQGADIHRLLLRVPNESAAEIREALSRAKQRTEAATQFQTVLGRFDEDDWRQFRATYESPGAPTMPARYYLSRLVPGLERSSPDVAEVLDRLVRGAETYGEFRTNLESLASSAREEARAAQSTPITHPVETFAGEATSIPSYITNLLHSLSSIRVLYLTETRKAIGRDEARQLLSLKMRRGRSDVLADIKTTVSDLLGVTIDAFESENSPRTGALAAEIDVDDFLVEANGSGIREALRLILDVAFQRPQLLLVEEPEVHLHPALEIEMMRYLKEISAETQVFISTHSTYFLDTADMTNVYLTTKNASTRIELVNMEAAEAKIPNELGIRLSALFMFDRVVFIEGPSDEGIIREIASLIGVNLSRAGVGFISMGGARNFTHFAAQTILAFLSKRRVKVWFIIDRDERDENDVARLEEKAKDGAEVYVLQRREIENYLIGASQICKFIRIKQEMAGKMGEGPSEDEVERVIEEEVEKLRDKTVEKRVVRALCRPIYPSLSAIFEKGKSEDFDKRVVAELERLEQELERGKMRVAEVYAEYSAEVKRVWASEKLNLVPGDELIDAVCQKFGVRFYKDQGDGAKLAGLMSAEDIPADLKAMITSIGV
jgi:ABC-type cobalamin/Fe3+-siderophores transport system ATPase subunit